MMTLEKIGELALACHRSISALEKAAEGFTGTDNQKEKVLEVGPVVVEYERALWEACREWELQQ